MGINLYSWKVLHCSRCSLATALLIDINIIFYLRLLLWQLTALPSKTLILWRNHGNSSFNFLKMVSLFKLHLSRPQQRLSVVLKWKHVTESETMIQPHQHIFASICSLTWRSYSLWAAVTLQRLPARSHSLFLTERDFLLTIQDSSILHSCTALTLQEEGQKQTTSKMVMNCVSFKLGACPTCSLIKHLYRDNH